MAGVSLSVLRLDDARLARLDAPTDAPAWPNAAARPRAGRVAAPAEPEPARAEVAAAGPPSTATGRALEAALLRATRALIEQADRLTGLDREVGDGDLGISLARGATAVQAALPSLPLDDPAAALHALGLVLQGSLGGTSGPLYGAFFLRASRRLRGGPADDPRAWAEAFRDGCDAVSELGGARAGDRTMLDALLPAASALEAAVGADASAVEAIRRAADAAEAGARATSGMVPRRGRSSYLGDRAAGHVDPGAEAVAVWLRALIPS